MNTLKLTVANAVRDCRFYIDGKQIALERGANGVQTAVWNTEREEAEIEIYKISELNGRLWFLSAIFFFVISCFGIFNSRYDKRCISVRYKAIVRLGQNTDLRLEFNRFAEGQPALSCFCDSSAEERENCFFTDKQAKKRFKLLTVVEVFLWLALIAVVAAFVIKAIIG